jgi:hypothetical protein
VAALRAKQEASGRVVIPAPPRPNAPKPEVAPATDERAA